MYILIDNFSHTAKVFKTKKELLNYAKENGFEVKRSRMNKNCYYTPDYVKLNLESD